MANYTSDGKKLVGVEYDDIPTLNDTVDGMMVISTDQRSIDENALFLQALDRTVTCYVLDEIYIIGNVSGFENLVKAIEAWNNNEI